jgi:hypothetical protein
MASSGSTTSLDTSPRTSFAGVEPLYVVANCEIDAYIASLKDSTASKAEIQLLTKLKFASDSTLDIDQQVNRLHEYYFQHHAFQHGLGEQGVVDSLNQELKNIESAIKDEARKLSVLGGVLHVAYSLALAKSKLEGNQEIEKVENQLEQNQNRRQSEIENNLTLLQEEKEDITTRLKNYREEKEERDNFHLLYQNHAAFLMKIKNRLATREHILNEIDLKISLLKDQRNHYFFYKSSRQAIENKIEELLYLRGCLVQPSCSVENALTAMQASQRHLLSQEKDFLDKIQKIDANCKAHSEYGRDSKHQPEAKQDVVEFAMSKDVEERKGVSPEEIAAQKKLFAMGVIDKRIQQLEDAFWQTKTKKLKVALLRELKGYLNAGCSLSDTTYYMRRHSPNKENIYLLFEGNTGDMMNRLERKELSKSDMIHMIDLEIVRLQNQRPEPLCIFVKSRKEKLQQRINALTKLKEVMATLDRKTCAEKAVRHDRIDPTIAAAADRSTVEKAMRNGLPQEHFEILMQHESRLVQDLIAWDKSQASTIRGVLENRPRPPHRQQVELPTRSEYNRIIASIKLPR